jgi:simple sugar transport system ATP-binding protein
MSLALRTKGITKRFPGVLANDQVDFDLRKGEIHALLGENGAGKTTLMNVIYGLYEPDAGEIFLDSKQVDIRTSKDAIAQGIGMVHQHFMLIPVFTVAENIMLGAETVRRLVLDQRGVAAQVREVSHQYGLDVDPDAYVKDLPVGVQQRVEIVKALYRKADILILDEPTAVLTPQEADDLFRIMRELASRGVSIIFITHKLKEVLAVADRITVMRDGQVVGTVRPQETDEPQLAAMMVGREVILTVEKGPAHPGEEVLRVENLHVFDDREVEIVRGVSFSVQAGEVLGIAGVQGNGQTELVEALTGLRQPHSGEIVMLEHDVTGKPPRPITETGMAHIPEDRQRHGLVLPFPVTDNLVLCTYYAPPFAKNGVLNHEAIDENGRRLVREFDVRTPSPYVPVSKLSGGNQQKVIVARELSRPIKLLIANQPTRGLDVGSIEYIHEEIVRMRDAGCGVLLVRPVYQGTVRIADGRRHCPDHRSVNDSIKYPVSSIQYPISNIQHRGAPSGQHPDPKRNRHHTGRPGPHLVRCGHRHRGPDHRGDREKPGFWEKPGF